MEDIDSWSRTVEKDIFKGTVHCSALCGWRRAYNKLCNCKEAHLTKSYKTSNSLMVRVAASLRDNREPQVNHIKPGPPTLSRSLEIIHSLYEHGPADTPIAPIPSI